MFTSTRPEKSAIEAINADVRQRVQDIYDMLTNWKSWAYVDMWPEVTFLDDQYVAVYYYQISSSGTFGTYYVGVVLFILIPLFLRGVFSFALHPVKALGIIMAAGFVVTLVSRLIGYDLSLVLAVPIIMLTGYILRDEKGPSTATFLGSLASSKPSRPSPVSWSVAPSKNSSRANDPAERQQQRNEAAYLRYHANRAAQYNAYHGTNSYDSQRRENLAREAERRAGMR